MARSSGESPALPVVEKAPEQAASGSGIHPSLFILCVFPSSLLGLVALLRDPPIAALRLSRSWVSFLRAMTS